MPQPVSFPRLGDPLDGQALAYVKRISAQRQAKFWNEILLDDPVIGPACGLVVGVAPIRNADGRYPLVWVYASPATAIVPDD
ncbi:hypothetical protein [Mycolicibacterium sp. CBMA 234]|uniref:hypothetical protein n=1 Tax=Mycolicibacterium sp. CBMA 234 TaxID=1918495 RepID=UPI001EE45F35|nr:hypothetical protein [Mycolicibacterium sp. CBMA 234]